MVGNLRNMAIDMSTEVSNQNRQLDRIHDKVSCWNSIECSLIWQALVSKGGGGGGGFDERTSTSLSRVEKFKFKSDILDQTLNLLDMNQISLIYLYLKQTTILDK